MARHLDKDPATYTKERDGFIRDLQHFHETRGTPFRRCPTLGGHEVDLYLLYSLVTQKGGWMKVNARGEWEGLFEQFNLPAKCVNSAVAIKQIYIRYLDRYEKVHFLGEEADRGSDDDEESRHKRWSARALHSVPLSYNYHQHNIADASRSYNGLSTTLHKPCDYDRLALSLISPLPNEQDFAVNVCTLLSNEGKHTLRLDRCPKLVDHLLAHTGVFNHESLRAVFAEVYSNVRKHSLNHFWHDIIEKIDLLDLVNENNFQVRKKSDDDSHSPPSQKWRTKNNNNNIVTQDKEGQKDEINKPEENNAKESQQCSSSSSSEKLVISDELDSDDSELFAVASDKLLTKGKGFKLKLEPNDREVFCTGRSLGTQDYVGQRVLQIAHILRNLSFTEENIQVLATSRTFIRFLLLCVNSRWNSINQLGLDMLSNIVVELSFKDQHDRLADCIIKFVTNGLHNQDRAVIIACLEILNKLSQRELNEDYLLRSLDRKVYAQVCSFLTLHDVMLLIYTLECLYALSSLGERACNYIVEVHGIIDTLVSLVTVEGKSYGPKACIGMKLVETVSGSVPAAVTQTTSVVGGNVSVTTITPTTTTNQNQQLQTQTQQHVFSGVQVTNNVPNILNINTTPIRPTSTITPRNIAAAATPQRSVVQQTQTLNVSTTQVTTTPQAITNTQQQQSIVSSTVNAQSFIQQQHAHQQAIQENEQFALAWLRATYEPCGHGKVEQQELYKQYLNSCAKIGRRGVIAPLHFPRLVRSVFGGTVGPNPPKNIETPSTLQYYEGIRPRIVPLIITLPSAALQHHITTHHNKTSPVTQRRKVGNATTTPPSATLTQIPTTILTEQIATAPADNPVPNSPASPILKAQLSAPPKPRDSPTKVDVKSQVLAHPHLSQALLGNSTVNKEQSTSTAMSNTVQLTPLSPGQTATQQQGGGAGQSSTSLIKSLLATKVNVNECMIPTHAVAAVSSMRNPANVVVAADQQVAQRQQQQRLLAAQQQQQQQQTSPGLQTFTTINKKVLPKPQPKTEPKSKASRLNGVRLVEPDSSGGTDNVSSSTSTMDKSQHLSQNNAENHYQPPPASVIASGGANSAFRGRREPPQPPPPPLAPLSTTCINSRAKTPRMDCEDSDSTGNNSVASSTGISSSNVAISSADDGENSLTSFEGILLNGIPNSLDIDAPCNDDSNSKDSIRNIKTNKPLMLADLLEKKVEKDPPILNGVICKELRIGDKGLELVDNHINKVLNMDNNTANSGETNKEVSVIVSAEHSDLRTSDVNSHPNNSCSDEVKGVKRSAEDDIAEIDTKKQRNDLVSSLAPPSSVIVSNNNNNNNVNVNQNGVDSPKPESVDSNGDENGANVSVSATAANLYASLAADVLEDEDEELLMQQDTTTNSASVQSVVVDEASTVAHLQQQLQQQQLQQQQQQQLQQQQQQQQLQQQQQQMQVVQGGPMHQQIIAVGAHGSSDQQLIVTAPRQIIVSQGQIQSATQQVLITAGGQIAVQQNPTGIKSQAGGQAANIPMLVQTTAGTNPQQQRGGPIMLSQPGGAPIHLVSHGSQVQLVQGTPGQPGQFVLQAATGPPGAPGTGSGQTHYVVAAQTQTALVQGQPQTVLVAQTPQQQGTPAKTIIILQQQPQPVQNTATHHQKVVVTPQGQQVVVTQVQRPILQSSTVTNNIPPALVSSTTNTQIQIQQQPNTAVMNSMKTTNQPTTVITQNTSSSTSAVITSTTIAPTNKTNQQQQIVAATTMKAGVTSRPQTPIVVVSVADDKVTPGTASLVNRSITTSSNTVIQQLPPTPVIRDYTNPYICEWRGCTIAKRFRSANEVYMHACEVHCSPSAGNTNDELLCLWDRCDTLRRKRFSLMTHLHDRHCSPDIMKAVAVRRRQLSQSGKTEIPAPAPPPPHPGYAPDAALHAIKRHALEFVNPKELQQKGQVRPSTTAVQTRPGVPNVVEQDDNEGPVTKSIRLTASLILRNLVIYSNNSRRYLKHYEPHLAGVALSNVESSRTIAHLLHDMNETSTLRR